MKKLIKTLQLVLISACACLFVLAFGACGSKAPEWYTGFVEEYPQEVVVGEDIQLNDFIDYVQINPDSGEWETSLFDPEYEFADYKLTLSNDKDSVDLTGKDVWTLDDSVYPGDWTFTYTITEKCDFKGTYSAPLRIVAPRMQMNYTKTSSVLSQYLGATLEYEEFFSALNIDVKSYFDYTLFIKEVFFRGKAYDLSKTTSYQFPATGTYRFSIVAKAEDGQEVEAMVAVKVDYKNIGTQTVYLRSTDTGVLTIDVGSAVSNVLINENEFAYTPTSNGITVTYEELYKNPGANIISFALASGVYCSYRVEVITEHITFNENGALSAFGVGYYRIGDKGYDLLANWTTHEHGEEGNYMLGTDKPSGSATLYFTITQAYVDYAFKDPAVDYIEFEFYAPCVIQTGMTTDGQGNPMSILDKYTEAEEQYPFSAELGYSYKMKMYREFFYGTIEETHNRMNEHILDNDDIEAGDPVFDTVIGERYRVILSGEKTDEGWTQPGWFLVDNFKLGFDDAQ